MDINNLIEKYKERLFFFAKGIVKNDLVAEDIVEETLIKVYKNEAIKSFKEKYQENYEPPLRCWLFTTVKNACINEIDHSNRVKKWERRFTEGLDHYDDNTFHHDIIRAEVVTELRKLLEPLPKQCKKIFINMYVQGLTAKETSQKLKLSISCVKTQKARGLQLINRFIKLHNITSSDFKTKIYEEVNGRVPIPLIEY